MSPAKCEVAFLGEITLEYIISSRIVTILLSPGRKVLKQKLLYFPIFPWPSVHPYPCGYYRYGNGNHKSIYISL